MKIKIILFFIVISLLCFVYTGCKKSESAASPDKKQITIGATLLNMSSEFIVMLNNAMQEKAKEEGIRLIVNDAQRNPERQVQQVESFIAQGVDAIILNPCEVDASSPAVVKAKKAGIPIINVNSETRDEPTVFVGSRDEESGRIALEYIAKRLNGKANIVIMQGFMGQAAQIKRDEGAKEVLKKYPEIKVLAQQTAEWDRAKAISLMENWIQSYGNKINAVFAQNDEMAMGAVLALEQAKMKNNVIVVGIDAIADALKAVRDGRLDATVFQDAKAQGRTAIEIALKIIKKEPYQKETFIPFRLVTKDNIEEFK